MNNIEVEPSVVKLNIEGPQVRKEGSLNTRTVTAVPADSDKSSRTTQQRVGMGCCIFSLAMLVAGAVTWGVNDSRNEDNAAGQGLFFAGVGMITCICCHDVVRVAREFIADRSYWQGEIE